MKAERNKAMELWAEVERLHQQLSDALADLRQAAHQELQGESESLEQLAEERTHALQLLRRSSGPRLTRQQQQLLSVLMLNRVSPEVLQRCAEGGYGSHDTQQPNPAAVPPR
ncbi:hypothetical protein V8C86DRAFT_3122173 [Haematococcus lacustris]